MDSLIYTVGLQMSPGCTAYTCIDDPGFYIKLSDFVLNLLSTDLSIYFMFYLSTVSAQQFLQVLDFRC